MCARFTLTAPASRVALLFDLALPLELTPRYNIAPTQNVLAVRLDEQNQKAYAWFRWGLVPSWADDLTIGQRLLNARCETVGEKPAFRDAIRKRRCLIAADGYFEWKGEKGQKQPYFVHLSGREPFAFAGIWERWHDPEDKLIETCSILTREANPRMRSLHDRMPVILPAATHARWLDPAIKQAAELNDLYDALPDDALGLYPVSTKVGNPRNEDPSFVEPLDAA
jgi:putative SOS response-associated peptidase YedK